MMTPKVVAGQKKNGRAGGSEVTGSSSDEARLNLITFWPAKILGSPLHCPYNGSGGKSFQEKYSRALDAAA